VTATPEVLRSRDNPLLQRLRKLARDPAAYRKLGLVWLEGDHLCRALRDGGGRPQQALVSESGWAAHRELASWAPKVALVPDALFAGISALESPAGIGFVLAHAEGAAATPGLASVVLDRLQDPGNVGSILRSAAALGFPQVLALKGTAALWSPKVLRAGMGAHFGLRLVEQLAADDLDRLGLPLVGSSSHAAQALHEAALPSPCAWVLGHEGQGVADDVARRCALTVRIPQPGGEESLNVAAAAAICLYESVRRRAA
jgi:TrmH family RNA methyltransferase